MWYRGNKTMWCDSDWYYIVRDDFNEEMAVELRHTWQEDYSQGKVRDCGRVEVVLPAGDSISYKGLEVRACLVMKGKKGGQCGWICMSMGWVLEGM